MLESRGLTDYRGRRTGSIVLLRRGTWGNKADTEPRTPESHEYRCYARHRIVGCCLVGYTPEAIIGAVWSAWNQQHQELYSTHNAVSSAAMASTTQGQGTCSQFVRLHRHISAPCARFAPLDTLIIRARQHKTPSCLVSSSYSTIICYNCADTNSRTAFSCYV